MPAVKLRQKNKTVYTSLRYALKIARSAGRLRLPETMVAGGASEARRPRQR